MSWVRVSADKHTRLDESVPPSPRGVHFSAFSCKYFASSGPERDSSLSADQMLTKKLFIASVC